MNSVNCPSCQRTFAFKPELAGRRVKCKCGGRIQFPDAAGEEILLPELETEPMGFEVEEEPVATAVACRGCGADLQEGAVLCMAYGYNQQTGQKVGTQVVRTQVTAPPVRKAARTKSASSFSSSSGFTTMVIGGVICVVGIGNTAGTYTLAKKGGGGMYLVAYGPMIFGAITFPKGFVRCLTGN